MATLTKIHSDGKREVKESGQRVEAIKWKKDGTLDKALSGKPIVGYSFLVGSIATRSYSSQDYWLTTVVTEILEEKENYTKFKTENSVYEFIY